MKCIAGYCIYMMNKEVDDAATCDYLKNMQCNCKIIKI